MLRKIGKLRLPFSYVMALLAILLAEKPFPIYILIPGILLIIVGVVIRFWASGHVVKEAVLTQTGPYAFTRNPLYLGSFISGLGLFILAHNWWLLAAYLLGFALFYGATIISEESFLTGKYGDDFLAYTKRVPRFFPQIIPSKTESKTRFTWERSNGNHEYRSLLCTIAAVALLFLAAYLRPILR